MKKYRRPGKSCRRCFAYIAADARKCKFCGYKYKSSGRYLLDRIRKALHIDRVFSVAKVKTRDERQNFFTAQEIENLLKLEDLKIQMYLILDDLALLDETSLIELGETLSIMYEN